MLLSENVAVATNCFVVPTAILEEDGEMENPVREADEAVAVALLDWPDRVAVIVEVPVPEMADAFPFVVIVMAPVLLLLQLTVLVISTAVPSE